MFNIDEVIREMVCTMQTTYNGTRLQRRTPLQKYKICKKQLLERFESVIEDNKDEIIKDFNRKNIIK